MEQQQAQQTSLIAASNKDDDQYTNNLTIQQSHLPKQGVHLTFDNFKTA